MSAPIRTTGARYFAKRRARPYADELPALDLARHAPADVAFAARAWTMRAEQERLSAGAFAALASGLVDCGEPLDLAAAFTRVAAEELAHSELCVAMAATLDAPVPQASPIERPTPGAVADRRAQVLSILLVEGAIGETISCALFTLGRNVSREPRTRAALGRILRDEIGHARVCWEALDALRSGLSDAEMVTLQDRTARALGSIEQVQMVPVLRRLERGEPFRPAWGHLGMLPPTRRVEAFYAAVEGRVLPALSRFGLDGERAWRERYERR